MRLWQYKNGAYAIKPRINGVYLHYYVHDDGVRWLHRQGVFAGDELPSGAYYVLQKNGWLFTTGQMPFGTPAEDLPTARARDVTTTSGTGCLVWPMALAGQRTTQTSERLSKATINTEGQDNPIANHSGSEIQDHRFWLGWITILIALLVLAALINSIDG